MLADEVGETTGESPQAVQGGVELALTARQVHDLTLLGGVASTLRLRVAAFDARHFSQLEKGAARVAWRQWISAGVPWRVEVTTARSRLYHSGAVAERIERVVSQALGSAPVEGSTPDRAPRGLRRARSPQQGAAVDALVVHARIKRDRCVLSVEPSGLGLHRRGWRLDPGRAPLREDLAHALLMASAWEPGMPLLDPCCGSGTLVITAARRAAGRPPGEARVSELDRWPGVVSGDREAWTREATERLEGTVASDGAGAGAIAGWDLHEAQLEAATRNAAAAGVADGISLRVADAREASGWPGDGHRPGMLLTNPPWGRRLPRAASAVKDPEEVRGLERGGGSLVQELAARVPEGWGLGLVLPTQGRGRFGRLGTGPVATVRVGGVQVRLEVRPGVGFGGGAGGPTAD